MFKNSKLKHLLGNPTFHLILPLLLICGFVAALHPVTSTEPSILGNEMMMFEENAVPELAKPGDRVTLTMTYSNNMSETAYNVTVYSFMPPELTFVSSAPFYDGASDSGIGFFRWSRGDVLPYENGTIAVRAMVNNVPVGTEITNTAHLAFEFQNGTKAEVASSAKLTVTQAAGVDIYPDQIHSVPPHTGAMTEYNITLKNTGNALDTFQISLRSVAYSPSSSSHDWKIEVYDSTGYFVEVPVAAVYDDNVNDRASWTDHGVVTSEALAMDESTWIVLRVTEAEGTSGSGDAYLDAQLIATSVFDPNVSGLTDEITIVRSVAGITLAPDYLKEANPGNSIVYSHIIVNSAQTEVIDLGYSSPMGWGYSFHFGNGTALTDTDGSGYVDIGQLPKNQYVYILVKVTVPFSTPAGTIDAALITATGVTSGNYDTANDTILVKSAPILSVDKKLVSGSPSYQGDTVTYQIHVANLGNTKLIRIPLDDAYETISLNFSSAQPAEHSHDETAGTIHWDDLGTLDPGQNMTVTVSFDATMGDDVVRQSTNVIDAEDEFGNLISASCTNRELKIIGTYALTVTASPTKALGGTFSLTWTERGVLRDGTFTTPRSVPCDQDTTATIGYPESPVYDGDVRYVFAEYLPSATIIIDSEKTVTLKYQTECALIFQQTGSSEPVYISIDGIQLPDALPQFVWIEKDSTVTFSYPSPVTDLAGTTRYVLARVSGNTSDTSVTVDAPTVVTGFYKTQYYLHVATEPLGLDTPQYSGWYDEGTYAKIEVETPTGGDGTSTRYRFDHWTEVGIDNTAGPSTQILMDTPKIATAHFVKQYYITIISTHDSPTTSLWVDEGSNLTVSVTSPSEIIASQTQWRCTGYTLDGETQVGTSYIFENVQAPHTVEFQWVQQFWLQVDTAVKDAIVEGSGWYDAGTLASISATTPYQPSPSHRFVFAHWASTGANDLPLIDSTSPDTAVTVNNYYTVQANWQEQWYISVISAHDNPTPSQWVNTAENMTISVTSPADNDGFGTRYRCFGYKIDDGAFVVGTEYVFLNVQAPHKIEFQWTAQYYLTVDTEPAGLDEPAGEGWFDNEAYAAISVTTLTGGDGVSTRYRFDHWTGTGISEADKTSTAILMDSPKLAKAVFIQQFHLTTATNFGVVSPQSGWYDIGSTVQIEATAPATVLGKGYVWHGWTGVGDGSYSGVHNPATVTINSAVFETATWKIDPILIITISNETVANGEKIVVYGEILPNQSGSAVSVIYELPDGSVVEHIVRTDDEGVFEDTLTLDQGYLYRLFFYDGEWKITARRLSDASYDNAETSTNMKIEARQMTQFPPILMAGAILVMGLIGYVSPIRKIRNTKNWRRATFALSCIGLILGVVSLTLNWVLVAGTVTTNGTAHHVDIQLNALNIGLVSISDGIQYVGPDVPSMVNLVWDNASGSPNPIVTLYLIPVGCALALIGFYKPKSMRQRNLKAAILMISALLIAASVIHTLVLVHMQMSAIKGAGVGYGPGMYIAMISSLLTLISGLAATREINNKSPNSKTPMTK